MILPDFKIPSRVNQHWKYSGIDSLSHCLNKQHFLSYPYEIDYQYNSRGFRDVEWPSNVDELKNAVWCIGDSFTVGIGSPYNFSWPQVLSNSVGRRCINVSMDGASNTWISRRACQIINEFSPTYMVVLWSYTHRRELLSSILPDDQKIVFYDKNSSDIDNIVNFINCYKTLNSCATNTKIFNGIIPNSGVPEIEIETKNIEQNWNNIKDSDWPDAFPLNETEFDLLPEHVKKDVFVQAPELLKYFEKNIIWKDFISANQLLLLKNLDWARDYHHFDIVTSKFFVSHAVDKLFTD